MIHLECVHFPRKIVIAQVLQSCLKCGSGVVESVLHLSDLVLLLFLKQSEYRTFEVALGHCDSPIVFLVIHQVATLAFLLGIDKTTVVIVTV